MRIKDSAKTMEFLLSLNSSKQRNFSGDSSDIIIPVMGPTGVGKSTFINSLLDSESSKNEVVIGHGLESCTRELIPSVIPFGSGQNKFINPNSANKGRLVLVDTPGFDDTYIDDVEILRLVSVWLALSYTNDIKLGGVICLHDITQTRMTGTTCRNLDVFRKMVGEDAFGCVVLATTKWTLVEPGIGAEREETLKSKFWEKMILAGSQVVSIADQGNQDSPRHIVNNLLTRVKQRSAKDVSLMIQKELVHKRKVIPQTDAGRTLRYSLDELLRSYKKKKAKSPADEEVQRKLLKGVKDLKVPLAARIKRIFL